MKSQEYNKGELANLTVNIEKDVVESFKAMVDNTGYTLDDLVVIAMRRFRASHSDYEKKLLKSE